MRNLFLDKGNEVNVLSSVPSYKKVDYKKTDKLITKINDSSVIYRIPVLRINNESINKLFNFIWFPVAVFFFLLFSKKYDIVTVSSNPPVILAFFVACATKIRKNKLVYHCMDIHPEIGKISGEFKNKYIFNIFRWMDNFTCKTASNIVVLSTDMKESLSSRDLNIDSKIDIINNYDLSDGEKSKDRYFPEDDKKRIVFTGNIGRFQKLEKFIEAIKKHDCLDNVELLFVGEGKYLNKLKELSFGLECVKFIPHQQINIARKIIEESSMGIVSLENEVIKYAFPSKTMTYLSEGTPVLVCMEEESELSKFILNNKLGSVLNINNIEEIYQLFISIRDENISYDRKHIKNIFENNFSKRIYEDKFLKLFSNLLENK
ncbi:glycosyltransferase family 4 protein [Sulfurimonas lithotrophica]|uniref:Glycosyltransferase family 4 protein n=1 Tax=Sulfurimonas lithotrophica TaxID=2590022 RepID=A0A5P8NZW8_9BACT|nr:glycosyltransferase family 4 protein [Sulfurimonas lithotrophica]QFR48900.1 glycosyltransferase family 4 protein [Sulfurimonas lithotrophica]